MSTSKYKRKSNKKVTALTSPVLSLKAESSRINPPSPHVPDWFKKELIKIGGVTDSGKPRYRIVWGPDEKVFAYGYQRIKYLQSSIRIPVGWEVIQNGERIVLPVEAANDPKYPIGVLVFEWLDKGKPFFFLEEWCPPEIACEEWELIRYETDWSKSFDDPTRTVDVLGPRPNDGIYRAVISMQDNDGNPLYPNESALEWLRRVIKIKESNPLLKNTHWRNKPEPGVIEQYIRQEYQRMYEAEAEYEAQLAEKNYELLKPHEHRLRGVTNPGNGYIIIR